MSVEHKQEEDTLAEVHQAEAHREGVRGEIAVVPPPMMLLILIGKNKI
jgi:hypothetical protein